MQSFELGRFFLHGRGLSLKVWRMPAFEQLPEEERALYKLLGRVPTVAMPELSAQSRQRLLQIIAQERLAGYVFHRVQQDDGELHQLVDPSFSDSLRRLLIVESAEYEMLRQKFVRLHKMLGELTENIIWLKGVGLSMQVYPDPSHRLFCDFDLLTVANLPALSEVLVKGQFEVDFEQSSQFGVGPMGSLQDLLLQPGKDWVACGPVTLCDTTRTCIDFKLDPFERGMKLKGTERFQRESLRVICSGLAIQCPGLRDQLIISCCHLHKDYFQEYRRLLDIHLICAKLDAADWLAIIDEAKKEGVCSSVWSGLSLVVNRLGTKVPYDVIEQLRPRGIGARFYTLMLNYRFVWNQNPLIALILHCCFAEDRQRKSRALAKTLFPGSAFLCEYYAGGRTVGPIIRFGLAVFHFCVVLLPAKAVSHVGRRIWSYQKRLARSNLQH